MTCKGLKNNAMNFSCKNTKDFGTLIAFPAFPQSTLCPASSGIPEPKSLVSSVGEKNGLWRLWPHPSYPLRPENPQSSRPALWRSAHLSGSGDPPSRLSKVPESEAGEAGLVGRLSFLHETVCFLCWPSLPGFEYSSRSRRAAFGLEDGQGLGDAVYAGAAPEGWDSGAAGDWHRRDFGPQRPRLPHCGERFGEAPGHLVWGKRPFGSEHGSFLCVVGAEEEQKNPTGGHGHVEAFSELDPEQCAASGHPF